MRNVYFVGQAGAGKTYACNYLKRKYGYIQSKFAFPVYGIAKDYFGMKKKDRKLLQIIGTDVGREIVDSNIWVNRFVEDITIVLSVYKKLYNKDINFVSDDVRFKNEHLLLKSLGWVGIYLDVTEDVRIKRLTKRDGNAQIKTLNHSSETGLNEFKNELIRVDSSRIEEYTYQQLDKILENMEINNVSKS